MYQIVVTHKDSEFGDEVMFDVTVLSNTVAEALTKAFQVRQYGLPIAHVEVDA